MTKDQLLRWRAALIDRCIQVVKIAEWFPDPDDDECLILAEGARTQLAASVEALELFKAGPKTEEEIK